MNTIYRTVWLAAGLGCVAVVAASNYHAMLRSFSALDSGASSGGALSIVEAAPASLGPREALLDAPNHHNAVHRPVATMSGVPTVEEGHRPPPVQGLRVVTRSDE